jgi:hypothetical protein
MPFSESEMKLRNMLGGVITALQDANVRLDALNTTSAIDLRRRHEAAVRSDALIMAETIRADNARRAAEEAAEEQERSYAERRQFDHTSGKFVETQKIFCDALSGFGRTVEPAPDGMSWTKYLRRCADTAQKYLPANSDFAKFDFLNPDEVPKSVLVKFSDAMLGEVRRAVRDPSTVARGKLREIINRDARTDAVVSREWIGADADWFGREFVRPGRRVLTFTAPIKPITY